MVLETLSHSPRVFSVFNFMDDEEADQIIEDALGMTQEDYRLKVRGGEQSRCGGGVGGVCRDSISDSLRGWYHYNPSRGTRL